MSGNSPGTGGWLAELPGHGAGFFGWLDDASVDDVGLPVGTVEEVAVLRATVTEQLGAVASVQEMSQLHASVELA